MCKKYNLFKNDGVQSTHMRQALKKYPKFFNNAPNFES